MILLGLLYESLFTFQLYCQSSILFTRHHVCLLPQFLFIALAFPMIGYHSFSYNWRTL